MSSLLKIELGNSENGALFDPGATVSFICGTLVKKFQEKLEAVKAVIKSVLGPATKCLGSLRVSLEIDGVLDNVTFKVLDSVKHDIILGIDFMRKWDIEVKNKQTQWRVGQTLLQDGDWHQFSNGMNN